VVITGERVSTREREIYVADMRSLTFEQRSFASVVAVQSIEHVPDPESVLAEVVRMLEPAGRAVFVRLVPRRTRQRLYDWRLNHRPGSAGHARPSPGTSLADSVSDVAPISSRRGETPFPLRLRRLSLRRRFG
jgi:ubiquinone/menaquinone biosynthesis C-methylase UbiE